MSKKNKKKEEENEVTIAPTPVTEWKKPEVIGIETNSVRITKHNTLNVDYLDRYNDNTHSKISKKCDATIHADLNGKVGILQTTFNFQDKDEPEENIDAENEQF